MNSSDRQHGSLERKPRVVRIITRLNVGGPARHVGWLDSALNERGVKETLITGQVPPGESDMSDFVENLGVHPMTLAEMSRELSFRDVFAIWKLYKLFREKSPDLIHTHTAKAGTVGRIAGWCYKWMTWGTLIGRPRSCRFVHTFHGHIFHGYYGKLKTWVFLTVERWLAWLVSDRIVVISPQQFEEIHHQFRVGNAEQFRVIRLGLDLTQYEHWQQQRELLRQEIGASEDEMLIGIVGRITEIKHHSLFVDAATLVAKRTDSPVRFVIIGDGPLREELELQSRSSPAKIQFMGMRDDPDVFYPGLDIVALTSKNEGTPLTLLEAMANARPVVSTLVGGVVDVLGNPQTSQPEQSESFTVFEHGVGVMEQTPEAVATGLEFLIKDASLREQMGVAGQKFVSREYTKDRLVEDIVDMYNELLPDGVHIPSDQPE